MAQLSEVFVYAHASDNVAPMATLSSSLGTVSTDYPLAYLVDGKFGRPCKWTTTTADVIFDHGTAVALDLVALGPHNLAASLANVKVQRHTSNSWTSPAVNQTISIPAYRADGTSVNPWLDLSGTSAYRYTRIAVTTANTATVQIGEVALYTTKRQLARNYQWSFTEDTIARGIEHRTEFGVVLPYSFGVSHRMLRMSIRGEESDRAALQTWYLDARGRRDPVLVVPDLTLNEAWFVRLPSTLSLTRQFTDVNDLDLVLEEVVRGPAL